MKLLNEIRTPRELYTVLMELHGSLPNAADKFKGQLAHVILKQIDFIPEYLNDEWNISGQFGETRSLNRNAYALHEYVYCNTRYTLRMQGASW